MVSVKENAYLRVSSAGSGNSLMIGADKGSGSVSAFINPPARSSDGIFYISFDITADNISNGEMYLSLRSANAGSNNSYDLFKLKSDGKIEYFSGNIDRDGNSAARYSEIKTGETKNIGILCNTRTKTAAAYENGFLIGGVADCSLVSKENKRPSFDNFYARFYMTSKDEYSIRIDNITAVEMREQIRDLLAGQLLIKVGDMFKTKYLFINNTNDEITGQLITAMYNNDILYDLKVDPIVLENNKLTMYLQDVGVIPEKQVKELKVYTMSDSIVPLMKPVQGSNIICE